jgi:Uma2 family endonuclease
MPIVRRRPATYCDLEALPPNLVGELIGGELFASPRPAAPHALAASALGMSLGPPFHFGRGGPGGWWILFEPELHLGEDVLVPDLAGWRRERMPEVPMVKAFTLAPDWLCEVLSPSTTTLDRARKLPIYARAEVAWVWLVDPLQHSVEVLRRQGGDWLLVQVEADDRAVKLPPFEAVELDLALVFASIPRAE